MLILLGTWSVQASPAADTGSSSQEAAVPAPVQPYQVGRCRCCTQPWRAHSAFIVLYQDDCIAFQIAGSQLAFCRVVRAVCTFLFGTASHHLVVDGVQASGAPAHMQQSEYGQQEEIRPWWSNQSQVNTLMGPHVQQDNMLLAYAILS